MQLVIHTSLKDSIRLDGVPEPLRVTGKEAEFYVREQTIIADRAFVVEVRHDGERVPGLRLLGLRILKSGARGQRATVELPLTDPQVPEWLREAAAKLTAKTELLRVIIAQQKEAMGVR
jgi:hypothetical protein